jgi:hypothetical protein
MITDIQSIIENIPCGLLYLGGSRRMAQKYKNDVIISDETDYDYNISFTQDAVNYLLNNGFTELDGDPAYKDNQAISFYQLCNYSVITRKDIYLYARAFESIPLYDYLTQHWKSSPKLIGKFCRYKTRDYFNNLFEVNK